MSGADRPLDRALDEMHEAHWDDDRGMVRLYGLHLVRETVLGAFLDLERGRIERAERAIRAVLTHQYPLVPATPWAGTFKLHADQPAAGSVDADGLRRDRVWHHFDPNWRQFLGMILLLIERLHGPSLPDDLRAAMLGAAERAARGERVARISPAYTNIALLHAWLADATGEGGADDLVRGVDAQVRRDGDVAEYNSPTYDAVSLLAACLMLEHSRSPAIRATGELVVDRICGRLNQLWHPVLGLQAGPYSRAYGLDPRLYVSLMSVLAASLGLPAAGPTRLTETTTHVHDLYFLPLFRRFCRPLVGRFTPSPIVAPRRLERRFGDAVATSVVDEGTVIGWEHGRRGRFALDQYAPFAMFSERGFIGVRTRPDTDWVDVRETASRVFTLTCARLDDHPSRDDRASLTIVASRPPITHDDELLFDEITLQFPGIAVEVRLASGEHRA